MSILSWGLWGTPGRHQKACRRLQRRRLDQCPLSPGQSGKLSRELDFVSHHVRTKLDELKRQEVSRLRMLLKAKMDAQQEPSERGGGGRGPRGRWAGPGGLPPRYLGDLGRGRLRGHLLTTFVKSV